MAIERYAVLKGRPTDRRLAAEGSTHYHIRVDVGRRDHRVAVNVRGSAWPSLVEYVLDADFDHPVTARLAALAPGLIAIARGQGLDYVRDGLFDRSHMRPLPATRPGPDNDLNEKIDRIVARAINEPDAMLYAFGEPFGPDPVADHGFGFAPSRGMHNIHMNQGSPEERFRGDNGVGQDGALLIAFPQGRWVALFLKFQSQAWHTDDTTGHPRQPMQARRRRMQA
ncbi:YukJ family protein [Inquilinus sp. OTU3971]|uniref:YukJ family protein n=1 Tax=Inquilinus sp. OTU3971 TaxID=3043855 RepID=UPI00313B27D2